MSNYIFFEELQLTVTSAYREKQISLCMRTNQNKLCANFVTNVRDCCSLHCVYSCTRA